LSLSHSRHYITLHHRSLFHHFITITSSPRVLHYANICVRTMKCSVSFSWGVSTGSKKLWEGRGKRDTMLSLPSFPVAVCASNSAWERGSKMFITTCHVVYLLHCSRAPFLYSLQLFIFIHFYYLMRKELHSVVFCKPSILLSTAPLSNIPLTTSTYRTTNYLNLSYHYTLSLYTNTYLTITYYNKKRQLSILCTLRLSILTL
jgi:hypothetical protein